MPNFTSTANHKFFDKWSYDMAYCLGFITADGYIHNKKSSLRFEIQEKDIELLYIFKDLIAPNNNIRNVSRRDKRTNKIYKSVCLEISSINIIDKLKNKFNITSRKSKKIRCKFHIPNKYIASYLRGIFDGDGSIYLNKNRLSCHITSASRWFLYDIKKLQNIGKIYTVKEKKYIYRWMIGSKNEVYQFLTYIYSTPGPYLRRKKDLWIKNI